MTKKRLSDMLKEEVNKADAPDPAATPAEAEAAPKPATTRRASSSRRTATSRQKPAAKASSRPKATTPKSAVDAAVESDAVKSEAKSKSKPVPEPIAGAEAIAAEPTPQDDLAQRLSALETDLATTKKDKAQLEKTVAGLQKDLETQQSRLFELKDSLAQAEAATQAKADALAKTQAELEEAKKTILKLTEAPPPPPSRISGVDILPRRPVEAKPNRPAYHRGVPDYAIQKGQPNPMLTDADIGWVD
ncbi:hypothetical protein [Nodosilinea nodulosa]|uniref:hypothetical protein n=1 Tax=Nodosilinea nodulosa TaxID=416001 RepID=UPI0002EE5991|nr:hypothetical protein [Nodosilinea nodulosa]